MFVTQDGGLPHLWNVGKYSPCAILRFRHGVKPREKRILNNEQTPMRRIPDPVSTVELVKL